MLPKTNERASFVTPRFDLVVTDLVVTDLVVTAGMAVSR